MQFNNNNNYNNYKLEYADFKIIPKIRNWKAWSWYKYIFLNI